MPKRDWTDVRKELRNKKRYGTTAAISAAVPYRFVVLYVIYFYSMTPISSGTMKSASVQALMSSTV